MVFEKQVHPLENSGVVALLSLAQKCGAELTLVGGYVRDAIAGRLSSVRAFDLDFAVGGFSPRELAERFEASGGGRAILLDDQTDTMRILLPDGSVCDLSALRGTDLLEDLKLRDFTINAIAWDRHTGELLDPAGGQNDIKARVIRVIDERAFTDDPLRMVRAFRFAAVLDFAICPVTFELVRKHKHLLERVAAERVSHELFLMLESGCGGRSIKLMGDCGLLEVIFPELEATHQVTKNSYHHLGLFDHSVEAVIQCERSIDCLPEWARARIACELSGQVSRLAATKLACLLHDIGKPDTWIITEEGKHTFIGHDKLGAQMCEPVSKRLRWSRPVANLIEKLVRWHLRPGALFHQGEPTDKAIFKFFRTIEEDLPELVLLAMSDFRSTCGPGLAAGRQEAERRLVELLDRYYVYREGVKKQPKLMNGVEVMTILGIKPGPVVGEILEELFEAVTLRQVLDRSQAEDFVKMRYAEKYCK